MSYRMSHVSPSALAATERCPRYRPDGQENPASAEGTMLHAELEAIVSEPVGTWNAWIAGRKLSAENRGLVEEAAQEVRALLPPGIPVVRDFKVSGEVPVGAYPECQVETYPGHHGYIDLLVVPMAGTAIVVDYKFVRAEHDYTLQLGAYAGALHRAAPSLGIFEAHIVAPRISGGIESHVWTLDEVEKIGKRIASVEEAADDPFVPGHPGEDCCHCHWNGRCPFQAAAIKTSAPESAELERTGERVLLNPSTPEERARRRDLVSWLTAWIERVKEDDSAWLAQDGASLPGYSCTRCMGRASLDKTRMREVYDALARDFVLEREDLMSVSSVDMKALVEFLMLRLGKSEKETKADVQKALDRFMVRGAPYTRLQKLSSGRAGISATAKLAAGK